jgi:hypothetical protein
LQYGIEIDTFGSGDPTKRDDIAATASLQAATAIRSISTAQTPAAHGLDHDAMPRGQVTEP